MEKQYLQSLLSKTDCDVGPFQGIGWYLQLSSSFGWSLANLVALLRMNLFTHRDLMAWLNQPFATPPDPQDDPQAVFAFA